MLLSNLSGNYVAGKKIMIIIIIIMNYKWSVSLDLRSFCADSVQPEWGWVAYSDN